MALSFIWIHIRVVVPVLGLVLGQPDLFLSCTESVSLNLA